MRGIYSAKGFVMRSLQQRCGLFSLVMAFAAMSLTVAASADALVSDDFDIDAGQSWSPGPVEGAQAPQQDWNDGTKNQFAWAGDRDFELLMSFDPDEEEVFLGWQIDF